MMVKKKVTLKQNLEKELSMPAGHLAARCECAMMRGYVMPVAEEDIDFVLLYIAKAMTCDEEMASLICTSIEATVTRNHDLGDIKFYVCNTVEGMRMISLLINVEEDDYSVLPKDACDLCHIPDHKFGGNAFWYAFTFNFDAPALSEFSDIFLEEVGGGFVHRIS